MYTRRENKYIGRLEAKRLEQGNLGGEDDKVYAIFIVILLCKYIHGLGKRPQWREKERGLVRLEGRVSVGGPYKPPPR